MMHFKKVGLALTLYTLLQTFSLAGPIAHKLASPSPFTVILWPDSVASPVNPRLVYQCADSQCSDMSKAVQVDYVTAVPVQSQYGAVSPTPSPISFIQPAGGAVSFAIYVSDSAQVTANPSWKSCILMLDANGLVIQPGTSCRGAVRTENATLMVSTIAFGAPPFANTVAKPPAGYKAYNPIPTRTISFKNSTAHSICINLESKFNTSNCTGAGDQLISSNDSYVLTLSSSTDGGGSMSRAAFVTGYFDGTNWHYSGKSSGLAGVYATAMEWSLFPTKPIQSTVAAGYTDHSIGMSDVDISAVNGYNFGVILSSDGAVCSSATSIAGQVQPAIYNYYSGAISVFPTDLSKFEATCPASPVFDGSNSTQLVTDSNGNFEGCLSPCQYASQVQIAAGLSDEQLNAICCAAGTKYDDSVLCTKTDIAWGNNARGGFKMIKHFDLPYVLNIGNNSQNVYSWQFDDNTGNFSCQPAASFTFDITVH